MQEFVVRFRSLREVQEFVSLCTKQPFTVKVGNERYQVNGTNFMGLFSLNCRNPQKVMVDCEEEAYLAFRQAAEKFLAEE